MPAAKGKPPQHESEEWSYIPSKYTINLSLPPQHRYDHVSSSPQMQEAIKNADINKLVNWLIDEGIMLLPLVSGERVPDFIPRLIKKTIRGLGRITLRRVDTDEETEELRGLSGGSGIEMFLLAAFNVLLDLLLRFTSGGVLWDGIGEEMEDEQDDEVGLSDNGVENGEAATNNGPLDNGYTTGRFRQTAYRRAKQSAQTSSATNSKSGSSRTKRNRIAHFRTLDWGMDPLRHLVVELEYVHYEGGPVIARTVGYFGYVGVLTGLRTGLSMSLNHRATHTRGSWAQRFSFRWNQLMVLFGVRPSISSTLRHILFNNNNDHGHDNTDRKKRDRKIGKWTAWKFLDLAHPRVESARTPTDTDEHELLPTAERSKLDVESVITALPMSPSTSAYLIFCTPEKAYSLEVDNGHIVSVQSLATFLTTTNHDLAHENEDNAKGNAKSGNENPSADGATAAVSGMAEVLGESFRRKKHARKAYTKAKRALYGRRIVCSSSSKKKVVPGVGLSLEDVIGIMNYKDIIHRSLTHYAVVMDPGTGRIVWKRGFYSDSDEEEDDDEEADDADEDTT